MKKIVLNKYIRFSLILILGIFMGWLFFHSSPAKVETHDHASEVAKAQIWTCSMHPQIRMDKPGKCPICAMDLIPVVQSGGATVDPSSIQMTKESAELANVLTTVVSRQSPVKELRLYGKVQADERLLQNQVAHISGRIDKLLVNFTGEPVSKGQKLAVIYSPDLVTAQQELLEAAKTKQSQPEIYEASKDKLRQWMLTEKQISDIESSRNVQANIDIVSNTNGIVTARRVNTGDHVGEGSILYEISNLSRVWVLFDAYESDLLFLKKGDKIDFTIQALPGTDFLGSIMFIDPIIDPVNRVAKVRVEINNPGGKLKPEMFATGMVKSNLEEFKDKLVIPRTAVLWTGKRSIVYVKQPGDEPVFKMREIELGPMLGESYVITGGLKEGDEIVTQGAFSVDAAAQLEGKPSMMNQMKTENDTHPMTSSHRMSGSTVQQQLKVAGTCDMCKERIETAAKSVDGVKNAEWSSEKQLLNLTFDGSKTSVETIAKAIAAVGHDTEKFKATDSIYKQLPECCYYRGK
jgi:membrane fusion protein, copper/silver efflux system